MADDEFKLPGSSLEEVEKVIEAYAQKSGPTTNDDFEQAHRHGQDRCVSQQRFVVVQAKPDFS
jgi:hypothetical protein